MSPRPRGRPEVVCRHNHKDDLLLGTIHAGTLRLGTDETWAWRMT